MARGFLVSKQKLETLNLFDLSPDDWDKIKGRIQDLVHLTKGRINVKGQLNIILNPDQPLTTAFLTKPQAHFANVAFFVADKWDEFKGLKDYAELMCLASLGVEGKGIKASEGLAASISGGKFLDKLSLAIKGKEK